MKMKSLTMLVMSSLLTLSCAYIAPVMADDDMTATQSLQQDSSDKVDQNDNGSTQNNDDSSTSSSNIGNDEGSPDTATGDDDY